MEFGNNLKKMMGIEGYTGVSMQTGVALRKLDADGKPEERRKPSVVEEKGKTQREAYTDLFGEDASKKRELAQEAKKKELLNKRSWYEDATKKVETIMEGKQADLPEIDKDKISGLAMDLLPAGAIVGMTKKFAGVSLEKLNKLLESNKKNLTIFNANTVESVMTFGADHSETLWNKGFVTKTKEKIAEIEAAIKEAYIPKAKITPDPLKIAQEQLEAKAKAGEFSWSNMNMGGGVSIDNTSDKALPTEGMIRKGNLDINHRIKVNNKDGSFSTIESMSFNEDGVEILIPTIDHNGKRMSSDKAIEFYKKTGEHLGMFASGELADKYAKELSKRQGRKYNKE